MSRPLRRLSVAATSALSITALTFGLATPAGAAPAGIQPDQDAIAATTEQLVGLDALDMASDASKDELIRTAERQASAPPVASRSVSPVAEEVSRTGTSVTFRFTLPAGETTSEDAVLQAFTEAFGYRVSQLTWLTDPAAGFGAQHDQSYSDQLQALQLADLIRANFTVTGATPVSRGMRDHFSVPAGQNSFEITIASVRTQEQLRESLRAITGVQPEDDWDEMDWQARMLLETRMALPQDGTWAYGDRLAVLKNLGGGLSYPDGALELRTTTVGSGFNSTSTVVRADGAAFSGDRVLGLGPEHLAFESIPMMGEMYDALISFMAPPPLRPGTLTTEVTGATHVRDGFYRPNQGVTVVTARTSGTGPTSLPEARERYTEWVTGTCDAEMTDPIPGYPATEGGEPVTWQAYLDQIDDELYGPVDDSEPALPVYTGAEYIDTLFDEKNQQVEALFDVYPGLSIEDIIAQLAELGYDWDAACGTSDDGGEPGQGQTPASVSLDVPSSGVAGSPLTLSARVTDSAGDPVSGQQVTFTISETSAGTLRLAAAGARASTTADGPTVLTATTGADGVATVEYTPTGSGTLRVSASTGGADPATSDSDSTITVTPAPGGGGDDDGPGDADGDDDAPAGSGSLGSLGSLFGSLGS